MPPKKTTTQVREEVPSTSPTLTQSGAAELTQVEELRRALESEKKAVEAARVEMERERGKMLAQLELQQEEKNRLAAERERSLQAELAKAKELHRKADAAMSGDDIRRERGRSVSRGRERTRDSLMGSRSRGDAFSFIRT
jgi:hypothetical protein